MLKDWPLFSVYDNNLKADQSTTSTQKSSMKDWKRHLSCFFFAFNYYLPEDAFSPHWVKGARDSGARRACGISTLHASPHLSDKQQQLWNQHKAVQGMLVTAFDTASLTTAQQAGSNRCNFLNQAWRCRDGESINIWFLPIMHLLHIQHLYQYFLNTQARKYSWHEAWKHKGKRF